MWFGAATASSFQSSSTSSPGGRMLLLWPSSNVLPKSHKRTGAPCGAAGWRGWQAEGLKAPFSMPKGIEWQGQVASWLGCLYWTNINHTELSSLIQEKGTSYIQTKFPVERESNIHLHMAFYLQPRKRQAFVIPAEKGLTMVGGLGQHWHAF